MRGAIGETMKWLVVLGIITIAIYVLVLVERKSDQRGTDEEVGKGAKETVENWLESQKVGDSGSEYWENRYPSLYAVSGWEIVKVDAGADTAKVRVRVDSCTKGGSKVTTLWDFTLIRGRIRWKLTSMVEHEY